MSADRPDRGDDRSGAPRGGEPPDAELPQGRERRAASPATERRRVDRRAGAGSARGDRARGGPGGIERRTFRRRRVPPPAPARAPSLETPATRRGRDPGDREGDREEDRAADASDERRRAALRSMLQMADERQARAAARRTERPVLAPGVAVGVLGGRFAGLGGTVLDADYISSRVLVRLDEVEESVWLGFAEVGGPPERPAPVRRGRASG